MQAFDDWLKGLAHEAAKELVAISVLLNIDPEQFSKDFMHYYSITNQDIMACHELCIRLFNMGYPMPWAGGDVALLSGWKHPSINYNSRD
jgi:hypothetical protein